MSYNNSFVPEGCSDRTTYPAMTIGVSTSNHSKLNRSILLKAVSQAGVVWDSAYTFAEAQGITIVGGYHETVGASGGWVMVRLL